MSSIRFRRVLSWLLALSLARGGGVKLDSDRGEASSVVSEYAGAEAEDAEWLAAEAASGDQAGTTVPTPTQRKIIYTADVSVVVEDFGEIPQRVVDLVNQHQGLWRAFPDLRSSSGRPRSGTWTIRVPVAGYGTFLEAVSGLGELQQVREDTEEVTAEYYDVEARIRNKQREEERLLELLETQTGKLQDILSVEKELSRVREEIQRYEGRLRVLKDQTTLSTSPCGSMNCEGISPTRALDSGHGSLVWSGSLDSLALLGQGLLIGLVALAPWLVILMVLVLFPVLWIRWMLRRRRRRANPATEVVEATVRNP